MRYVIYLISSIPIIFVLWVAFFAFIAPSIQNYVALSRAETFCNSISPGDSVSSHFPPKQEFKADIWTIYDKNKQYGAIFIGHFFDEAECLVTIGNGRVESKKTYMIYD